MSERASDPFAPPVRRPVLFVFSGPSGVGKSTLVRRLIERTELWRSVSMTTRKPRAGERDGADYIFVSREEFDRAVRDGDLIEHATVHGESYGTPRRPVEERLAEGKDVLLEIDVQGALAVRSRFPGARLVFVAPPSAEALEARLRSRRTEPEEKIVARMRRAREEMAAVGEYDYVIVNEDLDRAVADAEAVVRAERLRLADTRRG
jgi:guanylate kinase